MYSDRDLKKNHSEGNTYDERVPDEAMVDEIEEEDNKYEETPYESDGYKSQEKKEEEKEKYPLSSKKKEEYLHEEEVFEENVKPQHANKDEDIYEEEVFEEVRDEKENKKEEEREEPFEEEEPEEPEQKEEDNKANLDTNDVMGLIGLRLFGNRSRKEVEEAAIKIQKNLRGKLARDKYKLYKQRKFKVVFSRCVNLQSNLIGLRLVDNLKEVHPSYDLCCYNFTKSRQFATIDFPKNYVDLPELTADQLVSLLNIDVKNTKVEIKPEAEIKKHTNEIPEQENKREEAEEFLASVPLFFGKEKLDSTIHYDKKGDKILVKHGFEKNHPKTLEVEVKDLDMDSKFSKQEFINNMDIVLLSKLNYKNGGLIYEKSPIADSIFRHKQEDLKAKAKEEDPLPDLNDPDVQNAAFVIQNAYKKKTNKTKPKEPEEKRSIAPNKRYSEKALDEVDTQHLRNQKGPIDSTKSGFLFVNQEAEELHHGKHDQLSSKNINSSNQMGSFRGDDIYDDKSRQIKDSSDSLTRLASPKENVIEKDELPNLHDPDVQKAASTIQTAYKKKQNQAKTKTQQREKEERERQRQKEIEEMERLEKQKKEKKHWRDDRDELPDLEDPEVQQATFKIQNVYKKKTTKKNQNEKRKEKTPEPHREKKVEEKQKIKRREEDDLPDLHDPGVQNATLKIQKAYKKKTVKKDTQEVKPEKKIVHKDEDNDLPDLGRKDVQDATLKIQKAYKKKQGRNKNQPVKEEKQKQKTEEDELPDLNRQDVQDATLKIQKAYKKKQVRKNKPAKEERKVEKIKAVEKEDDDELPDLSRRDVQDATLKIQKAYKKKQDKKKTEPIKEEKEIEKRRETENAKTKEDDDELPDLSRRDVQDATLKIQKAYKKKQDKNKAKPVKEEKDVREIENLKNKEEDELPDLGRKDVQDATLKIQKAYKKKQDKSKSKAIAEEKLKDKKSEISFDHKKEQVNEEKNSEEKIENKKGDNEEAEELPDLNNPDVQNATLAIQKAYLKKKKGTVKKPSPPKQTKHNEPENDDYENDFEVVDSPVKEEKPKTLAKPERREKLEESGLVLKDVKDELDAFDGEKVEEDDDQPYDEKVSEPPKDDKKLKVKAEVDEEDFEPFEEEF